MFRAKRNTISVKRPKLQLIFIFLLASVVGVGLFVYTTGIESNVSKNQQLAEVLLTTGTIKPGMTLLEAQQSGLIAVKQIPISSKPLNAIDSVNQASENLVALKSIEEGQLILNSNFGTTLNYSGKLSIPDGFLAVTVKVEDQARVGSFLEPGLLVVVYVTGKNNNSSNSVTRVIIPSAQILAVGGNVRSDSGIESAFSGDNSMVTLALSPNSAIRLVNAAQSFPIYLGLLGKDTLIDPAQILTNSQLLAPTTSDGVKP
jgi:Flp pilus assembly protein CpaB